MNLNEKILTIGKAVRKRYYIVLLAAAISIQLFAGTGSPVRNYHYYTPENGVSAAVTAIGGINLTNASLTNTSYYNPALLAFRKKTTISTTVRTYYEDEMPLDSYGLPTPESSAWNSNFPACISVEAEDVAFNYINFAKLNFEAGNKGNNLNFANYYLNGYRFSYASKSETEDLALGFNATFLSSRVVHFKETTADDPYDTVFIDDRGFGYSIDLGGVYKTETFAVGFFIPNMLSKIYWKDDENVSMQSRLHTGVQYGTENSYVVTGYSGRFGFKSDHAYHFGFQQNIRMGTITGEYYTVPLRIGAYADENLRKLNQLNYSFGSGITYRYFDLDFSFSTADNSWNEYLFMATISVSMEQ